MTEPEYVDPNELRPGPIRHEALQPELLDLTRAVYDVVGPYLDTTLEQFEVGLMRELHPEDRSRRVVQHHVSLDRLPREASG